MNPASLFGSRLSQILIGALMASAWIMFAILHVRAFSAGGNWSYLVFCITESVTALFFLVRTTPVTVSSNPTDWALAFAGTFMSFLFAPSVSGVLPEAAAMIVAGAVLQLAGMLSLNRSIGIVPARRVLKTGGLYRIVRHPLYASYLVMFSAYLLANSSLRNLAVFAITMGLLAMRIEREERHLSLDDAYRSYMAQVKFRVLPFVY